MKLNFTGEHYYSVGFRATGPGEYDVAEEKSEQLLQDFPELFSRASDSEKVNDNKQHDSASLNLKKANKDQLLAHAQDLGITGLTKETTNDNIIAAIEAHNAQKEG